MAELDDAELRDLERAMYQGEIPVADEAATPPTRRRNILDRLLRR